MIVNKQYLGDSVYAEYDGYLLILTTENGHGPSNSIVLEPEILSNLLKHLAYIKDNGNEHKD